MYKISKFFENLLKTVFRVSLIIVLIMALYVGFQLVVAGKEDPKSIDLVVTEKFEEDKGFVLFDKNIKTSGKAKKVRVDFVTENDLSTNVFSISKADYERLEEGKAYVGRFQNGKLGYIQFDVEPNLNKEQPKEENKK